MAPLLSLPPWGSPGGFQDPRTWGTDKNGGPIFYIFPPPGGSPEEVPPPPVVVVVVVVVAIRVGGYR